MSPTAYRLARSVLFRLNPETAHEFSMRALRAAEAAGVLRLVAGAAPVAAPVRCMGLEFPNPVGLAAGLDKEGNCVDALGRFGFGHIEVGTFTPRPQPGNPRPRLFRLIPRQAIINRMGFNNPGIAAGVEHVRRSRSFRGVVGFNIGKNKDTPNDRAADDYLACLRAAWPVAGYLAVNLSSPNTPGLRDLQQADAAARLLEVLKREQQRLGAADGRHVPLLFKVAPDLGEEEVRALARVFLAGGLDGLIATNTTVARDSIAGDPRAAEAGGLSGPPLLGPSNRTLQQFAAALGGRIPLVGVGGINSPEDAIAKLHAGATLVQVYTSFIFHGPPLVRQIVARLARPLPATP